jgi:hypothetical protein
VPLTALFVSVFSALLLLHCGYCSAEEVIPFEYQDGLIWVKVKTAHADGPLDFLLDSGAGSSVLNLETARKLGVDMGRRERVRLVGASASAWRVNGFRASLGGIELRGNPLALDLSETSELCSRPIDGLLGFDFFEGRIVQIDFKARCVRLLDKADHHNACTVVALRVRNQALCVPISVNGSPAEWTRLDTGCDDGLHWVSGGGRRNEYVRASLKLGGEQITNVKTALHRSPIFPSEAGLLGNAVLDNYRVTIDAVNQRLSLRKS